MFVVDFAFVVCWSVEVEGGLQSGLNSTEESFVLCLLWSLFCRAVWCVLFFVVGRKESFLWI